MEKETTGKPKGSTAPYHHGNLRDALLKAATDAIKEVGVERLSMRAVSRTLGVSQSAPFRHFKDKNDLLAALASEGFQALARVQRQAKKGLQPPATLMATGVAYVEFACDNPDLFKLMFGSQLEDHTKARYPAPCDEGETAYGELHRTVQEGIDAGVFRDRPIEELAFAAWSMVHGLAYLSIEGSGPHVPDSAKHASIKSALEIFFLGIGNAGYELDT